VTEIAVTGGMCTASGTDQRDVRDGCRRYGSLEASIATSDVLARLGPKAVALAWPETALAFSRCGPSQSRHTRLGLGLARPRPRLLAGIVIVTGVDPRFLPRGSRGYGYDVRFPELYRDP
jgi:hypothetical protein